MKKYRYALKKFQYCNIYIYVLIITLFRNQYQQKRKTKPFTEKTVRIVTFANNHWTSFIINLHKSESFFFFDCVWLYFCKCDLNIQNLNNRFEIYVLTF